METRHDYLLHQLDKRQNTFPAVHTHTDVLMLLVHIYRTILYICILYIKSIRQIRRAHFTCCRTVSFLFVFEFFSIFLLLRMRFQFLNPIYLCNGYSNSHANIPPTTQYPVLTPTQIRMRMGEQTQSASKSCKKRREKEIAS